MPHTSHLAPLAAAAAAPRPAAAAATAAGAMTNSVAAPATRTPSRRLVSSLKSRLAASLLVPCRRPTTLNSSSAVRPATSSAYQTALPAALPPPLSSPPSVQAPERVSSLAAAASTAPAGSEAVRWTWPTPVRANRAIDVDGSAEGASNHNNDMVFARALRTSSTKPLPCAEDCASKIGASFAPPPPHRRPASPSATTAPTIAHHWPLPSALHTPPPPPHHLADLDHDPIPSLLLVSPRQLRSLDSALRAEVEQLVVPLTATAPALASDDAPSAAHGTATRRHPRFERIHADDRADPEALADRLALLWAKFTSDMLLRNYTASPSALVVSLYSLAIVGDTDLDNNTCASDSAFFDADSGHHLDIHDDETTPGVAASLRTSDSIRSKAAVQQSAPWSTGASTRHTTSRHSAAASLHSLMCHSTVPAELLGADLSAATIPPLLSAQYLLTHHVARVCTALFAKLQHVPHLALLRALVARPRDAMPCLLLYPPRAGIDDAAADAAALASPNPTRPVAHLAQRPIERLAVLLRAEIASSVAQLRRVLARSGLALPADQTLHDVMVRSVRLFVYVRCADPTVRWQMSPRDTDIEPASMAAVHDGTARTDHVVLFSVYPGLVRDTESHDFAAADDDDEGHSEMTTSSAPVVASANVPLLQAAQPPAVIVKERVFAVPVRDWSATARVSLPPLAVTPPASYPRSVAATFPRAATPRWLSPATQPADLLVVPPSPPTSSALLSSSTSITSLSSTSTYESPAAPAAPVVQCPLVRRHSVAAAELARFLDAHASPEPEQADLVVVRKHRSADAVLVVPRPARDRPERRMTTTPDGLRMLRMFLANANAPTAAVSVE
ncbi:hypothetical protein GGF31_008663 [Allomyces arbusculus]|nr:hypothetical protein GGF31_008663 [Allomyces arbusculus]